MAEYHLTGPLTDEDIKQLKIGDTVYISGEAFTCRSRLQKYIFDEKNVLPFSTEGRNILIHNGPIVIKEDGIDETYDVTEGEEKKDASAVPTKWHKLQITRFIKAIRGEDVPDLCDQHQGKIAVELIKRIYENSI